MDYIRSFSECVTMEPVFYKNENSHSLLKLTESASDREYLSFVELAFIVYQVDKIKGHRRNRCESHELGK